MTERHPVVDENHDPENPCGPATWTESTRCDVFEPDGTYLGVMVPPDGFSFHVNPVFDGDHVWAVTWGELEVTRVVRFRIELGGG